MLSAALLVLTLPQRIPKITIHTDKPTISVSKDLYGIFFEEINCSGDGGLYAEQVRNRSFEDSDKPLHWTFSKGAVLDRSQPRSTFNPTSVKIEEKATLENEGFWGYSFNPQTPQEFRIDAKGLGRIRVTIVDEAGKVIGGKDITVDSKDWAHTFTNFRPTATTRKGKLVLTVEPKTPISVDLVSLTPAETFANRPNGMRKDLGNAIKNLNPKFMRFPGGCWVEGDTMALSQRWKETVGPVEVRRTQPNIWGYMSTNGLGYHEYLQLCEDIGATAMFVVNCGMSHKEVVPMDKMAEYVDDALDAIEYATGSASTKWGSLRAKNGHPKPFDLKYLEIGNENGGPAYEERYALMYKAIKKKYPEVNLIACDWGGTPKKTKVDIIDEHYYNTPEFFFRNADKYDKYSRSGPKIYIGEYAVTSGGGKRNLLGALGEAAFMTGMEKNADVVIMGSYAPLFANTNKIAWDPDLIYFDNARIALTPSYHVQQMFGQNRADRIIKTELAGSFVETTKPFPTGHVGVGTWITQAEFKDFKDKNGSTENYVKPSFHEGAWTNENGVLKQSNNDTGTHAFFPLATGPKNHFSFKAKKTGGKEGFLVLVGRSDKDNNVWLNLGGWNNTLHAIEVTQGGGKSIIKQIPGKIESDRWYDIEIDYAPDHLKAYLDGKLIFDEKPVNAKSFFWVAGLDDKTREVVIKVVNGAAVSQMVDLDFPAMTNGKHTARVTTLTHADPKSVNTLDDPQKVSPKTIEIDFSGKTLNRAFPAHSVIVLRMKL